MKLRFSSNPIAADLAAQLDQEEAARAVELGARADTFTMTFAEDGALKGYAVFAPDDAAGYFVIYAARSLMTGLAKMVLASMFGAATISGKPLRVHTSKLQAMAQMMGANLSDIATDADGLPMGLFGHGQ